MHSPGINHGNLMTPPNHMMRLPPLMNAAIERDRERHVAAIRSSIDAGTYLTEHKIDVTADRALDPVLNAHVGDERDESGKRDDDGNGWDYIRP